MMKKVLLTLTAAGTLAVPAGLALAQEDDPVPTDPVATCEDHVRNRDRDRLNEQDPAAAHGQERAQRQLQLQLHDGDGDGDGDGTQAGETTQDRTHAETGGQAQNRLGETGRNGNGGQNG